MLIRSQDSKYLISLDVPEVTNLKSRFVYNFFTRDERSNASGSESYIPDSAKKSDLLSKIPRYVEIFFTSPELFNIKEDKKSNNKPQVKIKNLNLTNFEIPDFVRSLVNDTISTERITEYVNYEDNVSTPSDISFTVVDSKITNRISNKLNFLFEVAENNSNRNEFIESIMSLGNFDSKRLTEVTYILFNQKEDSKTVNESINSLDLVDPFDKIKKQKISCLLDTNNLSKLLASNSSRTDESTIEFKEIIRSISSNIVNLVDTNDQAHTYPTFKIVHMERARNSSPTNNWGVRIVGYVVTRAGKDEQGLDIPIEHSFYEAKGNSKHNTYIDDKIKYGYSYSYSVKTIVLIKHLIFENGSPMIAYSLMGSSDSQSTTVESVDHVSPSNFNYVYYEYDFVYGGLKINWQLPVSRKKSVKYVQVFRRSNIFEPFEIIAELDFDDSEIRTPKKELINQDKIFITVRDPITGRAKIPFQFVDRNFSKDSHYIYALALVDAHGLSSDYSQQTEVSFDRFKNKLKFKIISEAGAPKQYPNFYIDPTLDDNVYVRSFTVDAIKTSNYKKFLVYLDPDALSYTSYANQSELSLQHNVKDLDQKAKYLFQMINLDRQMDDTVTIEISKLNR